MRKRCTRVARPTSTSSRPVANGSSVPAWPTFTPRPSRRRTPSTTSWEVIPAGLSTRRTPSSELAGNLGPQDLDQLGIAEVGRDPGRAPVPAAAGRAGDARDVDAVVGRAQRDLAARRAAVAVGAQLAYEPGHGGALDGAQVVHDALGVALVGAAGGDVVARELRHGLQSAVEALDGGQAAGQ